MNRKSLLVSNPAGFGSPKKDKRQSLSSLNLNKADTQLYEAIIKDPNKRAMVLQLLSQEKHLINDYLRKEGKTPIKCTKKKVYCESPTALFRRRALEKKDAAEGTDSSSSSEGKAVVPSPVPFAKLLEGVVAFVEVKTKSGDRSSATKAVVASMGAKIRDHLTRDVTHVIFKDGSYSTFHKAKLIKAHVVSLLWIEAVRKNHARVPEKNYPPLGTEAFNANVSLLCQEMQEEYEEALQDEVNKTFNSSCVSPEKVLFKRRATALPSELLPSLGKYLKTKTRRETIQNLSEENQSLVSSDSSDYGLIDGEITKKLPDSLQLSDNSGIMKSIENICDSKSKNNSADTSNGSASLLDVKKLQAVTSGKKKKTENENVDMDLTGNSGTMLKVTTAAKLLPITTAANKENKKKKSAKQKLFADDTTVSTDSDLTKLSSSNELLNLKLTADDSNKVADEIDGSENNSCKGKVKKPSVSPKMSVGNINSTMSSLRLSSSTNGNKESETSDELLKTRRQKRRTNVTSTEASPPKIKKQENGTISKNTTRRKLYNPDEELNDSNLKEIEDNAKNKKTQRTKLTQPTIPLTPVLLTTRAKLYLDERKIVSTPAKSPQGKIVKTARNTAKKTRAINVASKESEKKRSSSFYFDNTPIKSTQKKIKKKSSIVCTRLHKPEVELFQQIVKKLGGFFVEDEVSNDTTHLVAGESKRTINLLRALSRGCWILKHEWLLKSLEAGKWLPEEEYELTEFSRAVQRCRIERQAFGSSYSMDIFQNCGYIYVARSTIPRCSDLQELVKLCKGKLTTALNRAKIVVGEKVHHDEEVACVKETWILDSIAENKLKPLKNYIIIQKF